MNYERDHRQVVEEEVEYDPDGVMEVIVHHLGVPGTLDCLLDEVPLVEVLKALEEHCFNSCSVSEHVHSRVLDALLELDFEEETAD